MKRLLLPSVLSLAGLLAACCAPQAMAAQPGGSTLTGRGLADLVRPEGFQGALGLASAATPVVQQDVLEPAIPNDREKLEAFAAKVSYAGVILLTADRVFRSMDSVLEHMKVTRPDGTVLHLEMGPASGGMSVGLKVSRPLD